MPAAARRANVRTSPGPAPSAPAPKRNLPVERGPAPPPADPAPKAAPPVRFRLRGVLLGLLAVGAGFALQPRARAAWKLHTDASNLADYALCMVGPTGPALLRDGSPGFRALERRRLVAAEANERPFQDCAKLAFDLTGSAAVERAHRAMAWSFVEYGGAASDRAQQGSKSELALDDLGVSAHGLSVLAERSWPFVRDGWVKLVKPSLVAKEAMHPVELPRPGVGRGLPQWRAGYRAVGEVDGALTLALGKAANMSVFRSSDGGVNWRPAPVHGVESFAERCPAGDRSYAFSLSDDGSALVVTSHGPDAPPHSAALAKGNLEIVGTSCDERALVAAVQAEGSREVGVALCAFHGSCRALPLPRFAGVGATPTAPLDVARVAGVTILATAMHGVVRVASTRDDGQTWTPFTVAFDDAEHRDVRVDVRVPTRLLVVGKRVFLHGGAPKPGQTYSVLVSDDFGASWRTPEVAPAVVARAGR